MRGEERIEKEDDERGGEEKREKTKKGYEGAEEVGEEGKNKRNMGFVHFFIVTVM